VKRKAIDKDFDDPEVQADRGPSIEDMWSEEAYALYGPPHDTAVEVGRWFETNRIEPVLDVGCGRGLFAHGFSGKLVGIDRSMAQLRRSRGLRVLGDALALPFGDESFPAVVALYLLYFFEEPSLVALEARRVLEPGGCFAVCAPSRFDAPELDHVAPQGERESFMAEDIPALLFEHFRDVRITTWDFPAFDLRDPAMVRDYLYSWYYPQLTLEEAARRAQQVATPLKLTKRGAWATGRKAAD
jgi:SAM-dependent methyltransferase